MSDDSLNSLRWAQLLTLTSLLIVSLSCHGTTTVGDSNDKSNDVRSEADSKPVDGDTETTKRSDAIGDSAATKEDSNSVEPDPEPDRTLATLEKALDRTDLAVDEIIEVRGRNELEDGGGGVFRVTDSGCEADGGTCFIPDTHLAEADEEVGKLGGGSVKLSEDDLAWRGFQIRYGPEDEDVIGILDLHGTNYRHSAENRPLVSFEEGTVGWDGAWRFFAPLRDIEGTWNRSKQYSLLSLCDLSGSA